MTFLEAIDAAKEGKKIRDVNWYEGIYAFYKDGFWRWKNTSDDREYDSVDLFLNDEYEIYEDKAHEKADFLKDFYVLCSQDGNIASTIRFKNKKDALDYYKHYVSNSEMYILHLRVVEKTEGAANHGTADL